MALAGRELLLRAVPAEATALRGCVLTPTRAIENGYVVIDAAEIKAVSEQEPDGVRVHDTAGVIAPGLIDLHGHPEFNVFAAWEPPSAISVTGVRSNHHGAGQPRAAPAANQRRDNKEESMLSINLALVSEVEGHEPSDVARVGAALSRQATRDFAPIWNMEGATVDPFPTLEDVPVGYWPMIVVEDVQDAAGVHLDKDGQPFALIEMSDSWSLTASHEALEMLADPWGNRLIPGRSIKPDQGRVAYLVEVCDPSEAAEFGYTVNDILVSDFYTPRFFDPTGSPSTRYSFTGAITEPRTVLRGGYISWQDPVSDHWWQQTWFENEKEYRDLGVFDAQAASIRAWIDSQTDHPGIDHGLDPSDKTLADAVAVGEQTAKSAASRAAALRERVGSLTGK